MNAESKIEILLEKKNSEFIAYQHYVIDNIINEINKFADVAGPALAKYEKSYAGPRYVSKNLCIQTLSNGCINVETNCDWEEKSTEKMHISFNNYRKKQGVIYPRTTDLHKFSCQIIAFKEYERFWHTIKKELPKEAKYLLDWEKNHEEFLINCLEHISFSIPDNVRNCYEKTEETVEKEEDIEDMEM